MARRRHRRRSRRFGDFVSVPLGLGKFKLPRMRDLNPLGKTVRSTDVAVGALVGLAGGAGIRWLIGKFWTTAPAWLMNNIGPVSTVGAGLAALVFLKNKNKATGYFAGAALVGLTPIAWGFVTRQFPALASFVSVDYGYPVDVHPSASSGPYAGGEYGLIVDEGKRGLSALGAHMMGDDDDGDYALAVGIF